MRKYKRCALCGDVYLDFQLYGPEATAICWCCLRYHKEQGVIVKMANAFIESVLRGDSVDRVVASVLSVTPRHNPRVNMPITPDEIEAANKRKSPPDCGKDAT